MSRFGCSSLSQIEEVARDSEPKNTRKSKQYIWRQFMYFTEERNYVLNETTSISELANVLEDWAFNMRKQNGQEYKEYTIKTIWNVTAKMLMEKYYQDFNITFNPFTDIAFKLARNAKGAKRKQLQQDPEKRKRSAVFLSYEEFKKMIITCSEDDPDGLQKKVFFVLSFELAWRGGEGASCLVTFFKEELSNEGVITGRIEYNPLFSKTTQGGDKPCASSKWIIKNTQNPDICPVRLYQKFMKKRNGIKSDRLFLTVNPSWKFSKWYKDVPAGRNIITTWTSNQAKMLGLKTDKKRITNHSLRATAVSKLAKEGIEEQQLIKITGHSNAKSITPYLQMDAEHHAKIIRKMRDSTTSEEPAPKVSPELSISNETVDMQLLEPSISMPNKINNLQSSGIRDNQKRHIYIDCVFNNN